MKRKIIDISQEVLGCRIWPGHQHPEVQRHMSIPEGDVCNLTSFSMNNHNGTHMDAPAHFIADGKTIDEIPVDVFVGECYVAQHEGEVTREDMMNILLRAESVNEDSPKRLLIGGDIVITPEAAELLPQCGVILYGNEAQGVGNGDTAVALHHTLLGAGMVILEGIVLTHVPEGMYMLSAAPLNIAGCEGAPVRAVLIKD